MKITKSQLKKIIKEELEEAAGFNYLTHYVPARRNVMRSLGAIIASLHPEGNLSKNAKQDNPEIFKAINTAYSILSKLSADLAQDLKVAAKGVETAPAPTKQERSKPFKW